MLNTHLASDDEYMRKMVAIISIKFDKYWGDCNMLMSIASVLDPRYKMEFLKFIFPQLYNVVDSQDHLKKVMEVLKELYQTYVSESETTGSKDTTIKDKKQFSSNSQQVIDFEQFCDTNSVAEKTELELYLEEKHFKFQPSTHFTFDVLGWSKVHSINKPILSMMA